MCDIFDACALQKRFFFYSELLRKHWTSKKRGMKTIINHVHQRSPVQTVAFVYFYTAEICMCKNNIFKLIYLGIVSLSLSSSGCVYYLDQWYCTQCEKSNFNWRKSGEIHRRDNFCVQLHVNMQANGKPKKSTYIRMRREQQNEKNNKATQQKCRMATAQAVNNHSTCMYNVHTAARTDTQNREAIDRCEKYRKTIFILSHSV